LEEDSLRKEKIKENQAKMKLLLATNARSRGITKMSVLK
jgi:hypothetical protein